MEPFESSPSQRPDEKDKKRRATDMVRRFMLRSEEYRRTHIELARLSRELYECWQIETKSPIQRANLKQPFGFTIIQTEIPQIVSAVLKERPFAEIDANENPNFLYESALTDYCDTQITNMNFPVKLVSYVTAMKLDGTAFAKVPYRYKEKLIRRKKVVPDTLTGIPLLTKEEGSVPVFDGPDFEPIPMVDAFPDWSVKVAGDVDAMRGFVHRTWRTWAELKATKKYSNLSELDLSIQTKGAGEGIAWKEPYFSDTYVDRFDRLDDNRRGIKHRDKIEIWEYWGLFDEDGKGNFKEYTITIANGDVCLRVEENQYDYKIKPFIATPNTVRDKEFYGIPELMAVKSLIKESNTIRNARLDQINLAINRMYVVDRNAGIKAKSLYTRPSGIIWANDINGIRELPAPEIPNTVLEESSEIKGDIQLAVGLANTPTGSSGINKAAARSATGIQFMDQFASARVGLSLTILSETLIKPLYHIMLMTNEQYVTDEKWVKTSDPDMAAVNPFTKLPPEAWQDSWTFQIRTVFETGGRQQDLQKMQLLSQLLQTAEKTQPGVTDWQAVFEAIGRDLVGARYKKFIRSPQDQQALQAQGAASQEAASAMAGAMAPQPLAAGAATGAIPASPLAPSSLVGGGNQ